ncbi:MAG: oxidoreductase [Candidatus Tectomicrobia bacterium]|uniref:Oxidoreductase n=1 Tax=Tectimicrobiota bacterium TaxID=2528274 RepID=A0A938B0D0_UNCTE|nr:oxidoreductase [Candidatus Tectomicrobia bacterium]
MCREITYELRTITNFQGHMTPQKSLWLMYTLALLLLVTWGPGSLVLHAATTVYDVISPGTLQPGNPIPAPKESVVLTVRGRLGPTFMTATVTFDIPTLEHLGLVRFTTPTAWSDAPITFEGVLLSRLLEILAVPPDITALTLTALNDYEVTIPMSDVHAWPVMLALKRDGQYMSVRNKGPLWVVYPRHAFAELQQAKHNAKWIWQVKELVIH